MSCTQTAAWTHARRSETQGVLFGQCGWSGDVAGLVTSIRQRGHCGGQKRCTVCQPERLRRLGAWPQFLHEHKLTNLPAGVPKQHVGRWKKRVCVGQYGTSTKHGWPIHQPPIVNSKLHGQSAPKIPGPAPKGAAQESINANPPLPQGPTKGIQSSILRASRHIHWR